VISIPPVGRIQDQLFRRILFRHHAITWSLKPPDVHVKLTNSTPTRTNHRTIASPVQLGTPIRVLRPHRIQRRRNVHLVPDRAATTTPLKGHRLPVVDQAVTAIPQQLPDAYRMAPTTDTTRTASKDESRSWRFSNVHHHTDLLETP